MIKNILTWYNYKFKKNPLIVLISTIGILIISFGGLISAVNTIKQFKDNFRDPYLKHYDIISSINLGDNIEYISNRVGYPPKIKRKYEFNRNYTEYLYIHDLYMLHAITNNAGILKKFTITSIVDNFYPPIPHTRSKLGKYNMGTIPYEHTIDIFINASAKIGEYSELYYWNNHGYTEYYALGYTQLGVDFSNNDLTTSILVLGFTPNHQTHDFIEKYKLLREDFKPNSFSIIDPYFEDNITATSVGFNVFEGTPLLRKHYEKLYH